MFKQKVSQIKLKIIFAIIHCSHTQRFEPPIRQSIQISHQQTTSCCPGSTWEGSSVAPNPTILKTKSLSMEMSSAETGLQQGVTSACEPPFRGYVLLLKATNELTRWPHSLQPRIPLTHHSVPSHGHKWTASGGQEQRKRMWSFCPLIFSQPLLTVSSGASWAWCTLSFGNQRVSPPSTFPSSLWTHKNVLHPNTTL